MQHITTKAAAATTTDQGSFSALAATYSRDRGGDEIVPGAFEKTIKAWQETQRNLPLHWDHESSPESIIGFIDPNRMAETDEGLYVEGQLDLEKSEVAREAWRSMKANALALSFGYLTVKSRREGEINKLLELDLFEVSIVPAPMNNDTRVLSLKNINEARAEVDLPPISDADPKELRQRTFDAALGVAKDNQPTRKSISPDEVPEPEPAEVEVDDGKVTVTIEPPQQVLAEPDGELVEAAVLDDPLRKQTFDVALEVSNGGMKVRKHLPEPEPEPEPLDAVALRRRCDELALDIARGQ